VEAVEKLADWQGPVELEMMSVLLRSRTKTRRPQAREAEAARYAADIMQRLFFCFGLSAVHPI
jgi:hypothetical protein